jgi:ribulose-5-phosphate 4-epimerase/fuculose-1-phosphate aldolase
MTPLNGGNLSVRVPGGFAVTASGSHLGALEPDDVVLVRRCDVVAEEVCWEGARAPSSESLLHHLVLHAHPEAGAVVHAHDPAATRAALRAAGLPETEREEPYGTLALAQRALATFAGGERLIVLRDHGYVAVATTLEAAIEDLVATHRRVVASGRP